MKSKFLVLCLFSTLFVITFTQFTAIADNSDLKHKAISGNQGNASKLSHDSANAVKTTAKGVVAPSAVNAAKAPAPGTTPSLSKIPAATQRLMASPKKEQKSSWKPALNQKLVKEYKKPKNLKPAIPALNFRNYHAASQVPKSPGSNFNNGGFELDSTNLLNWNVSDNGGGSWYVQTGTSSPLNFFSVASPTEGVNAAMTDMTGPGSHLLYQDFVVPPNAILSFDFYVQNLAGAWFVPEPASLDPNVVPNQQVRIDIMDPSAPVDDVGSGVLLNLFVPQTSDPTIYGYVTASADLSAFAGQTVRLRFAEVDNQLFNLFGIDNVRLSSGAIGLVADNATNSVVAFDPKTDTVLTSIPIPANCGVMGPVAISPDGTKGYVGNFCGQIYVIDLTQTPPVMDAGTNPISVSVAGEDLSITPDGRYLVASNFGLSVVDLQTRTEIGTNPIQVESVAVCSDNSVLTGDSAFNNGVHRFTIDGSGVLTDTGENLGGISADNVTCAPGSLTGLAPDFDSTAVHSFGITGLGAIDVDSITSGGQTSIVNAAGNKAYVRSSDCSNPHVDYFTYDFATGVMNPTGISITPTGGIGTDCWFAIDQLALYGNKLYVSANGAVEIYNATNGAFIGSITDGSISNPTGIAIWMPPATGTGLVADNASSSVVVFDPGTDTVTGVVPIPVNGGVIGDVEVSRDGTLGFVSNFAGQVYVIDLKATPPRLASGTNPIAMSQPGEDLALTPDGNFLLSCDGGGNTTISIVDIAARTESSTFSTPCNGIQVCADNSVLTVSASGESHRLTIDGSGVMSDTGEVLGAGTMNTNCGRSALTGLTLDSLANSYTIPGMTLVDQEFLSSSIAQTVVSNRDGNRLFVRSSDCFTPFVDYFDYNFLTGQMSYSGITIPLAGGLVDCYYGIDQLATYGNKLYASQPGSLNVYNDTDGSLITSITDSAISNPTGVTIHTPNLRPTSANDSYVTDQDVQLDVSAPGVLSNDTDANGDLLTAVLDLGASNGTVILNPDGSFSYLPNNGFGGDDSFQYHSSDGLEDSNVVTVNIHINTAPVAVDDSYSTNKNIALNVSAPGVLGNDGDDVGPITAVLDSGTSNGTLTFNSDGSFTYTPDGGFSGNDSFTYHANDGSLDSNIATVNISVVNSAPVASDDSYNVLHDAQLNISAPGVLSNDSDGDGDSLSVVKDTDPPDGTVFLNADGSFTYIPDPGFVGVDTFTYHANDGTDDSNIATVTINVLNAAPTAVNDSYSTVKNIALNISAPGVLGNDTDPDADPLTAILNVGPTNGSLTLNPDGSFTYTPNANFVGADSFTYHANDGAADSNTATVSIDVTNDAPVAVDDSYVTDKNVVLNVPAPGVMGNDSDPNGDPLTTFLNVGPVNGTLTLNADGSFDYTPNPDYVGSDSFTYHVKDGLDDSNIATVNITVNQTCLYCDDFNDGTLDPNWTYVKPTWTEGGGNLMGTPAKKKAIAAATPVFAGCQVCSMEAGMLTAGGISNKLWMLGWYVDKKNTMELLMKEESEKWVLKQRVNGKVVAKAKGIKTIDPNTVYAARIVFDGTSFQVFIDDFQTPLFTLTPQGAVPVGTVGFSVKNTTGSFDYVTVN